MVTLEMYLGVIVLVVIVGSVWALASVFRATFEPIDDVYAVEQRLSDLRKVNNEEHRPL